MDVMQAFLPHPDQSDVLSIEFDISETKLLEVEAYDEMRIPS